MVTYYWSLLFDNEFRAGFNPLDDVLEFDDVLISAAQVSFTEGGANVTISVAGKTVTLVGIGGISNLAASNFTFSDGSVIRIGDDDLALSNENNANSLVGSSSNDQLIGLGGADTLDGGAGADRMIGGTGDDIYKVDDAGDAVMENADEGIDTVQSSISYTLGANVESLLLTDFSGIGGTGNSLDNQITGNSGDNIIQGLGGNDTLDGGAGADEMAGGLGDDTYLVDSVADVVTENGSEGTDLVQSSVNISLSADVENLLLTGFSDISGAGNSLDNEITGNSGNNLIDGGGGADAMTGGWGNDTYVVDDAADVVTENAFEGTDLVQSSIAYTLGANVDNLTLTGAVSINGTGNGGNNTITGNSGHNVLDGGSGADAMAGGAGNDTYVVDNGADAVTESVLEGTDLVQSSITYTLGTNVENLSLTGSASIDGAGNDDDNTLTGNSGSNVLHGGSGNDILDGGTGADGLIGGDGNDIYMVDDAGDTVTEGSGAGTGTDTVNTALASYALGANVENLSYTATGNFTGTGNALNNTITGGSGNDSLDGGVGADILVGGAGNDSYTVDDAGDSIEEGSAAGTDTVNTTLSSYTLGANLENLIYTGSGNFAGTGNSLGNTISGGSGNDILDGGTGADGLIGGDGNDTYMVDDAGDTVTEGSGTGSGTDTVNTALASYALGANVENLSYTATGNFTGTGNALNNTITGGSGNDSLDGGSGHDILYGGAGADNMIGGAGNDTYTVDDAGDSVTEDSGTGTGTDTINTILISYTLGANLEKLTYTGIGDFTGTGNTLNNTITGGAGNDSLDGGVGADILVGGAGNDSYTVDDAGDVVTESSGAGSGTDTVSTALASHTLAANVENLTYTGAGNFTGTGNALDNTITGGIGNDILDGGAGADNMVGGTGNDTFTVDNVGDSVTEGATAGTDRVNASISGYVLTDHVENLNLIGLSVSGTGNNLDNILSGNIYYASTLDGGAGADTMSGFSGTDTFYVDNVGDVIEAQSGYNKVFASIDYTLLNTPDSKARELTLTGTENLNGTGNELSNTIVGNSGDNILDGGLDADILQGGQGNDTYILEDFFSYVDSVVENFNEGIDRVKSSLTHTLASNVENLELTGSFNRDGTGNELDNVLVGNIGINHLDGGAGNDRFEGGDGNDWLTGGSGMDIFVLSQGSEDYIWDFVTGSGGDLIDLTGILAGAANYTIGSNPFASGHVRIIGFSGSSVQVDSDGGGDSYVAVGEVRIVAPTAFTADNFVGAFNPAEQPNQAPIGDVSISGTAAENQWLLSQLNYSDPDGAGAPFYQWQASIDGTNWSNLSGATQNGLWLEDLAVGRQIRVVVSYTDNRGFHETLTSAATVPVANVNDLSTGSVTVGGEAKEQRTLIAGNSLGDADGLGTIAYQWQDSTDASNWSDIDGATSGSLLLVEAQVGRHIRVVATYTDLHGTVESVASNPTGTVANTIDYSSVSATLGTGVEDLVLTGTANIDGTGNELDNKITGNGGNNILDGKAGWDTLTGGAGNDTYIVENTHDVVVEADNEGTDSVTTSVDYQLPDNVENLTLGAGGLHGWGNALGNTLDGGGALDGNAGDDTLIGGYGEDILNGGDGNDTLDGRQGNDTLSGGAGDDTYIVASAGDVVEEFSSGGTDTVLSSAVSYALADNVESLILTGSAIEGIGNWLDNAITGTDGNNGLNGGAGIDTLTGGAGNDTYIVDAAGDIIVEQEGGGIDQVYSSSATYALSANVENLALTGLIASGGATHLTGNDLGNVITGGDGIDSIDGGAGADTMNGYYGNDIYRVDNIGDVVSDPSGYELVYSSITYTLPDGLEYLSLVGSSSINGTGNWDTNYITGNSGDNLLDGGGTIYADILEGGQGNDTYVVRRWNDSVAESADQGVDGVIASVSVVLSANVENLALTGSLDLNGTGNELDNVILGNAGSNHLDGGAGKDRLDGGDGNDFLAGGTGADVFVLSAGSKDYITDFVTGTGGDRIDLGAVVAGFTNYTPGDDPFVTGHLRLIPSVSDYLGTAIQVDEDGGGNSYVTLGVLMDVFATAPTAANFVGAFDPAQQPDQPYAGDIAIPGTATEEDYLLSTDTLTDPDGAGLKSYQWQRSSDGTTWSNIDGLAGTQWAFWPDEVDVGKQLRLQASYTDGRGFLTTITTAATAAVVNVNDLPTGSVTVSGTAKEQRTLVAGNSLDDADGLDTISYQWQGSSNGSNWNDINGATTSSLLLGDAQVGKYIRVVASYTDLHGTVESVSGNPTGTVANTIDYSSVSWTLGAGVEDLVLISTANIDGTGNELDNKITGNSGNNGLNGGPGNDRLDGGTGADWLQGDAGTDTLILTPDSVWSSAYVGFNEGSPTTAGTGQRVSLIGKNRFSDVLDGGSDTDTLQLTNGNDAYFLHDAFSGFTAGVTLATDVRGQASAVRGLSIEQILAGGGDDLIDLTSANYSIAGVTVDGGSGNDMLWGNAGNDTLLGGDGNDTLFGGAGNDFLSGGAGADVFQFVHSGGGSDQISDFDTAQDKLRLYGATSPSELTSEVIGSDRVLNWNGQSITLLGLTDTPSAGWFVLG